MVSIIRVISVVLAVASLWPAGALGQTVSSVRVGSGFTQPLFATSAPGDPTTLYVVERGGLIRTLNPATGTIGGTPFLNLGAVTGANLLATGSEQGLLGLAFHPTYQASTGGFLYVSYTATGADAGGVNRVDRLTVTAGVVEPGSRQTVIEIAHPVNTNHNAGWIGFNPLNGTTGPNSGHLYIGTGDGGGANDLSNNAQTLTSLRGKLLRLDVNTTSGGNNYGIPVGNMTTGGARPEIYSYGLRNPFRGSFDRATGNLYIGDVGQNNREEIDFIAHGSPGGQNFGWRLREGTIATPTPVGGPVGGPPPAGNVEPIHDYIRALGASVTGGYVYRGPVADFQGNYVFGDFISERIWTFRYDGQFIPTATELTSQLQNAPGGFVLDSPSSFAEDGFGNLYVVDYGGEIFQIVPVPEPATAGLVATAAGVIVAVRRRRRGRPLHE